MPTQLLTDPFLQNPTPTAVQVVWFTEFEGQGHQVRWGLPGQSPEANLLNQAIATTTRLSRTREDGQSRLNHPNFPDLEQTVSRPIWANPSASALPGRQHRYRRVGCGEPCVYAGGCPRGRAVPQNSADLRSSEYAHDRR